MSIPVEKKHDSYTVQSEKQMYQNWFRALGEVKEISIRDLRKQQKELFLKIIQNELPPKQKDYTFLYLYKGMKMREIAELYGVDKSVVSRQIKTAMVTIRRYAKYISMDLYKIIESNPSFDIKPTAYKQNRKGILG